ncbi:MAG: hypothetical protein AAFZ17_01415 [Cyanobacteria bacterium J06650_10]
MRAGGGAAPWSQGGLGFGERSHLKSHVVKASELNEPSYFASSAAHAAPPATHYHR